MNAPATIIRPTIGRRVWYWPSDFDRTNAPTIIQAADREQACDAGIVYVHSDRLVNLTVADHNGNMHARTSVTLVQPGDERPSGAHATWMPYQQQHIAPRRVLTDADAAADLAGTERPTPTWVKPDGTTVQSAAVPDAA